MQNKKKYIEQSKGTWYWHKMHIKIRYGTDECTIFSAKELYSVLNRLVHGMEAKSGTTNDQFFKTHFEGGLWFVAVEQKKDYFTFHYFLQCYSHNRILSKEIKQGIASRLKCIAPKATLRFEPDSLTPIQNSLEIGLSVYDLTNIPTRIFPDTPFYKSLGPDFDSVCTKIATDDCTIFGKLFQLIDDIKVF